MSARVGPVEHAYARAILAWRAAPAATRGEPPTHPRARGRGQSPSLSDGGQRRASDERIKAALAIADGRVAR